jgi:hypothetical protein
VRIFFLVTADNLKESDSSDMRQSFSTRILFHRRSVANLEIFECGGKLSVL